MTSGQMDKERTLRDRAADFVARLSSDDASEADWLALEAWLAEDPAHLTAYERAESLWAGLEEKADALRTVLSDVDGSPVVDLTARREKGRQWRWIAIASAAAAAAAVILIGGPMIVPTTQTYATSPGETRLVTLSDGTRINLNGGSTIKVRMGLRERRVDMADAEAAFDVAHSANRPFLVNVGDRQVRVVGTEFNIARHAPQTTVTVRRGIVEVRSTNATTQADRLNAGNQLTAVDKGAAKRASVDADQAFAWREGRLIYQDRPLVEVAADLSRRFETPVTVAPDAAGVRFTGVLVLDNEAAVIGRLEALSAVVADRTTGAITLRSRK